MAWDSDEDIAGVFKQFGYTPTEAEISSLRPSFAEGMGGNVATSAVGQYVNFKNEEAERQKNDPLAALQTKMEDNVTLMKNQITGLQGQLQDTLSAAPELFGSLTPDQIQTYLKPLQDTFKQQMSTVQSTIASRGLAASSTENNALAHTDQQFKNQVFSTGLQVGMTQQQAKAQALQTQINNLFGLTGHEEGLSASAAAQRSSQNLGQSNLISSLPSFLNAQSAQEAAFNKAMNPDTGGFMNTFNKVTSGINQGVGAFQSLAMVPQQFRTNTPGAAPGVNAPNTPYMPTSAPGGAQFGMGAPDPSTAFMSPEAALFAAP